jgi:hypothetical protein
VASCFSSSATREQNTMNDPEPDYQPTFETIPFPEMLDLVTGDPRFRFLEQAGWESWRLGYEGEEMIRMRGRFNIVRRAYINFHLVRRTGAWMAKNAAERPPDGA